ncbi:NAD-dependent epimerase/dehydratase family protein [Parapedobacter deserti]|uniref:NAD-dependent epimerase/dehydratase family protein n=1 Tax=Parapedobacter deserti TaxID=1912957 RepID=A0ABV7JEF0_9SPHI
MPAQLHTVLGASGATGRAVILELAKRNLSIRAVHRSAKPSESGTVQANLLDKEQTIRAIDGSSYVYLCVGLQYRSKVWERDWPLLMANVIEACIVTKAVLIFFDNVYMYSKPLHNPFNEQHPQQPSTKKGIARKSVADLLLSSVRKHKLQAVIGRSADFYGPHAVNSPFHISFLERMLCGKSPMALGKANARHTYAYTIDNGKALVELALDESTYGQVWHLPAGDPLTIEQLTELFNCALSTRYETAYLSHFLRTTLSLFIPPLREVTEMLYQFEDDYIMSSDKFKDHFPRFKVTPYEVGISEMIKSFEN